jgi:hypothetical protein
VACVCWMGGRTKEVVEARDTRCRHLCGLENSARDRRNCAIVQQFEVEQCERSAFYFAWYY